MAAVTLVAKPIPQTKKIATVGTALQEVIVGNGSKQVTIQGSAALYYQGSGTDGGAVSAHAFPFSANTPYTLALGGGAGGQSFFVASQTGTADVYLLTEGAL